MIFAGLKLKELAHLRRNHAEELFKHIFPIVPDHSVVKDCTQLVRLFFRIMMIILTLECLKRILSKINSKDYPVPDANNPPNLRHFLQDAMESNDGEGKFCCLQNSRLQIIKDLFELSLISQLKVFKDPPGIVEKQSPMYTSFLLIPVIMTKWFLAVLSTKVIFVEGFVSF